MSTAHHYSSSGVSIDRLPHGRHGVLSSCGNFAKEAARIRIFLLSDLCLSMMIIARPCTVQAPLLTCMPALRKLCSSTPTPSLSAEGF